MRSQALIGMLAEPAPLRVVAALVLGAAHTVADRVMTGQVSVNPPTSGWGVPPPVGGFTDSGSPFKEQGVEGMGFHTRVKTVAMRAG